MAVDPLLSGRVAVQNGDQIRLTLIGATTAFQYRLLISLVTLDGIAAGEITIFLESTTDRTAVTGTATIPRDAFINAAGIQGYGAQPSQPGQVWGAVDVLRQSNMVVSLLQDWVYSGHNPTWPPDKVNWQEPPGRRYVLTTANPAAGAEIAAQTIPTNAIWLLRSFSITLAQGITQTPRPSLLLRDASDNILAQIDGGAELVASTTVRFTWSLAMGYTAANNVNNGWAHAGLPEIYLDEAFDFITSTEGIGANSDYGVGVYEVEEWITS